MKWFKITELIRCYKDYGRCEECKLKQAAKTLPNGIEGNMLAVGMEILDPAREAFGRPIVVNSGFRCPLHNQTVGGAGGSGSGRVSQHVVGQAVDICCSHDGFSSMREWKEANLELARVIVKQGKWDQMILENVGSGDLLPNWVHVSYKKNGGNRKDILKKVAGKAGYLRLTHEELKRLMA